MTTEKICPTCGMVYDPVNPDLVGYWVATKNIDLLVNCQEKLKVAIEALERIEPQPPGCDAAWYAKEALEKIKALP